jgi:hypothetical protein
MNPPIIERLRDVHRIDYATRIEAAGIITDLLAALDDAKSIIEALADNDLDEPIADNGMTVGTGLQMRAPALAVKILAAIARAKGGAA